MCFVFRSTISNANIVISCIYYTIKITPLSILNKKIGFTRFFYWLYPF